MTQKRFVKLVAKLIGGLQVPRSILGGAAHVAIVEGKDAQIAALTAALSSGICSAHQNPEPLTCELCNGVTVLLRGTAEIATLLDCLEHRPANRASAMFMACELEYPACAWEKMKAAEPEKGTP